MWYIAYLVMGGLLFTIMKNISDWGPSCLSTQSCFLNNQLKRGKTKTKNKQEIK